jgi:hypothetical protein
MAGRTGRWLLIFSTIFALYLAIGIVIEIGVMGVIAWPFLFLAWAAVFRVSVFLGENAEEILYETDGSDSREQQADKPGPKDRRISSGTPDSQSFRNVSRVIGEVARREPLHAKETGKRSADPSTNRERQANRDFTDFLRST